MNIFDPDYEFPEPTTEELKMRSWAACDPTPAPVKLATKPKKSTKELFLEIPRKTPKPQKVEVVSVTHEIKPKKKNTFTIDGGVATFVANEWTTTIADGFPHALIPISTKNGVVLPAHSHVGASSMKRVVNCPVSVFLGHDLEEKEETKYSKEGTTAHELAEIRLDEYLNWFPFAALEDINNVRKAEGKPIFNAEMDRHAKDYALFCRGKVENYMKPEFNFRYKIEAKMVGDLSRHMFGTVDFVFLYTDEAGSHLIIIDYKYGKGVEVENDENFQTLEYVHYSCEDLAEYGPFVDADMYIFQPRIARDALEVGEEEDDSEESEGNEREVSDKITPYSVTIEELYEDWIPIFNAAVDLANEWIANGECPPEDMAKYQKVGSWCKFCKCKDTVCEAYSGNRKDKLLALFKKAAPVISKPSKAKGKETNPVEEIKQAYKTGFFSAEELEFMALNKAALTNLVDGMAKAAGAIALKGGQFPNSKLIEANSPRFYIEDEAKVIRILKKRGVEEPTVTTTSLIGFSKIEKDYGKEVLKGLLQESNKKSYKLVEKDHPKPEVRPETNTAVLFKSAIKK